MGNRREQEERERRRVRRKKKRCWQSEGKSERVWVVRDS